MLNKNYRFMKSLSKFFIVSIILSIGVAYARIANPNDLVKINTYQSFDKVYPGTEFKLAVEVNVAEGWHINSHQPYDEYLISTSLKIQETPNFKLKKVVYPEPHDLKLAFSESPLSVWEGTVYKGALVEVDSNLTSGTYPLIVELEYQACNNVSCQAPASVFDTLLIQVADRTTPVNMINEQIFKKVNISLSDAAPTTKKASDPISNALEGKGLIIGLLLVFLGGLALNLTPCVYPLIPITIGYFGGQSEGSTTKLFFMGILFILGLAVTYSAIGVVTSLTGAVFGSLLQNPIVILAVVAILVILSLSMFGVYEFKLPDALVNKAGGAKAGFFGAFFMGLTMGIVAAPCIGPFVLGLVTYVATKQDPYFGFLLFFVLAVGLGTPYLFLAVFSGKIKKLPRAGEWMDAVKHIFGFILIGMALYFLLPLLSESFRGYILPVFMIGTAVYLLFFEKLANSIKGFRIFKIVFSLLILTFGIYSLIPSENHSIQWKPFAQDALKQISGKGAIIDFYADWCIPCKELDASTFSDPKVIELSKNFETYKANMTESLSPEVEKLREKYNIVGVPTVLILDTNGEEKERITGFVNAEEFYKIISSIE